jgi:hypothetical protein
MAEISQTHVRPICVLLLLNYISRETVIILVHTPSPKTEAGQQHLAQFNDKKKLKSHNLKTDKYTVILYYSAVKTKLSPKKKWPFIPCRLSPPPLAVADGTRYYRSFYWRLV